MLFKIDTENKFKQKMVLKDQQLFQKGSIMNKSN